MTFPRRLLNDGEEIIVSTRTHAKAMLGPALVLLVTAAVAGFLTALPTGEAADFLALVIWLLAGVVILWFVVRPFLGWLTTTYTFTNRRFVKRSGLVSKRGRTIPLNRISGVDFEIGVVDRVFGCGTLVVSDASEHGRVMLEDIPNVEQVQMLVSDELHRLSRPGHGDDGT